MGGLDPTGEAIGVVPQTYHRLYGLVNNLCKGTCTWCVRGSHPTGSLSPGCGILTPHRLTPLPSQARPQERQISSDITGNHLRPGVAKFIEMACFEANQSRALLEDSDSMIELTPDFLKGVWASN